MIEKLKNGNTLVTLGEGTVFIGNVGAGENEKPFGIYISDTEGKSENAIIIAIPNNKAVASYMMAMVRFMEAQMDDTTQQEVIDGIKGLKELLEPMMPKKKAE